MNAFCFEEPEDQSTYDLFRVTNSLVEPMVVNIQLNGKEVPIINGGGHRCFPYCHGRNNIPEVARSPTSR